MPGDTPCPVCSMQSERQRVAAMARLDTFLRGVTSHSVEDVLRDAFDLYEAAAAAVSDGQTILTRDRCGNVRQLPLPRTLSQSSEGRPPRAR